MADYRLLLSLRGGQGTITVNGVAPVLFYPEGTSLTIAIDLAPGFNVVRWYAAPENTFLSAASSFTFVMPSADAKIYATAEGQSAPINDYGLKYEGGYATNYGGSVFNLQILRAGYTGDVTPLLINDITYNLGNTGNDPLETFIGSSLDFTIAGQTGDFNEFLVGGNRTWKVVLNEIGANNDITEWNGLTVSNGYKDITFGNGVFVGTFGPFRAYSLDGITWNESSPVGWQAEAVTFGNGIFVAVGYAIVSGIGKAFAYSSVDGINWTSRTPAADNNWVDVSFGNGLFIAVADSGSNNRIMTSPDGVTWTIRSTPLDAGFTALAYGPGIWVAVSTSSPGGTTMTSYDGLSWDEQATVFNANAIIYDAGLFTTGNFYSINGLVWNTATGASNPLAITYGNGYFIGVNAVGTNRIYYSTDAITWDSTPAASNATFQAIAFGKNTFVIGADGGLERINYLLFEGLQVFFSGYIAPDFITSQFKSGFKLYEFTAIDGIKGFDAIRSEFVSWPDPRTQALSGVVGPLNQSFVEKRPVMLASNVHETRMDDTLPAFRQFNLPLNAIYTDGEVAKFNNGVRIQNEQLSLQETIQRMVNPFLCRVFLWKNKFYVVRLTEMMKTAYKAYTFNPDLSILSSEMVVNGDDINADINRPEETARRVFTEFNSFLNLGILDLDSNGSVFNAKFMASEWSQNTPDSPYPNTYQLRLWDYHNAIPTNQPTSRPSGPTALVQYVSALDTEFAQIWTTTSTAGIADPDISWISANSSSTGNQIKIAQEGANKISLSFEYMVERISDEFPITPGAHNVGIMVKIGNQYLTRATSTTFAWSGTETIMQFLVTAGSVFNSIAINNVIVPVDGDVEIRLYQLISVGAPPNRYAIRYRNLSLKIEQTDGLSLSKLGVKAVTGSPYSNVHPDYNTFIGDAITSNSASAMTLLTAGLPVTELWTRDGVEELPLLDIIVQELANLKGRTNYRIIGTLERRPIEPHRAFLFNGRYWAIISYQLDIRTGTAQIELYDLGIEPTT